MPGGVRGEYGGYCRRCRVDVAERLELLVTIAARSTSPAELADPELRARRVAAAAAVLEDPATTWELRQQLLRDYPELGGRERSPP